MIAARIVLVVQDLFPGAMSSKSRSIQITFPEGTSALNRVPSAGIVPVMRAPDGTGTMAGFFAVPPGTGGQVYPTTFHPAMQSVSSASAVTVNADDHPSGVDVLLALVPERVRVSGVVVGPAEAVANLPVRLVIAGNESVGAGGETALTKTDAAGHFLLAQVPQGDYTVTVGPLNNFSLDGAWSLRSAGPSAAIPFFPHFGTAVAGQADVSVRVSGSTASSVSGRVSVSVGTTPIDGLAVLLTGVGVIVSGNAVYDGADAPGAGHSDSSFGPLIAIEPADGDLGKTMEYSAPHPKSPEPTFSIHNVLPGRYRLVDGPGPHSDYHLIGATWIGQYLFERPLEVIGDGPVTGFVVQLSS